MRFGCCVNMLVPLGQGTGAEYVECVAAAGFDYLELPAVRIAALSEAEFATVCRRVAAAGLTTESCNDFFPTTMRLTGLMANRADALNYAALALERAEALGAKFVVFGSGPARMVPEGFSHAAAEEQLVGLLEDLVPLAEKHGLTIAIEALNHTECNIVLSLIEAEKLAKQINHPRIQLLADYYHFAIEREPIEHVAAVAKSIRHVHFSNPIGRGYPHEGDDHFTAFCRQLTASGYDDRMSVEAYSQDFERDAEATLMLMKRLVVSS
jgi:D-psicose/D-tagatose/L-ribulose 3-epimerase